MSRSVREIPLSMSGQPKEAVDKYFQLLKRGEHPNIAAICASRKGPKSDTDGAHYEGMGMAHLEKTAGKRYVDKTVAEARRAGISINSSSIYNATVADTRCGGDPNAWLLVGDGRDKFKKAIYRSGGECPELGVNGTQKRFDDHFAKLDRHNKRKARKAERQAELADKKAR